MSYRATQFADFSPEHATHGCTPERLAHLEEHGFVIINDFVDSDWISVLLDAGRRLTEACAPEHGYSKIDCSKGFVHRHGEQEPWAIRGIIHPALGEPVFAEFHGSAEWLNLVKAWCGASPEELWMTPMLLWCNPRKGEMGPGWHRDVIWWGSGKEHPAGSRKTYGPEDYAEEVERTRWEEMQADNVKLVHEREGLSIFLALVDEECHELIPGSHARWRTPLEHDVLLPQHIKDQGVPHTPSWNGEDPLPDQVAIRLKPGEALVRNHYTIHSGHTVPERERCTLSIGWKKWPGLSDDEPEVCDARSAWQLDPAVREALPHEWMKIAWDRWAVTQKLGDTLEERYDAFDVARIKAGEVVGWRGELERQAAAAGEAWESYQKVT